MRNYSRHGMTGTKIHEVWKEMNRRCKGTSKNSIEYFRKNIKVCEEWRNAKVFIDWALSNGYSEGLQLDRIDNKGNYEPSNCRFVTPKENANNKENTIYLTYNGKRQNLLNWSIETGIKRSTLDTRIRRGWSVERTLTTGAR